MKRAFRLFLAIVNLTAFVIFCIAMYKTGLTVSPGSFNIEYKDLISIILSAISLLITVLGFFLALAAIWGYNTLRNEAHKAAKDRAKDWLDSEGPKLIEEYIRAQGEGLAKASQKPDIDIEPEQKSEAIAQSTEVTKDENDENGR